MKPQSQDRRKHYFINKKFQLAFILKFCAIVIIGSFISIGLIYAISKGTVTTSFENSRLVIKSTSDFILPGVLMISAVIVLCASIATVFVTLYTSHKIAGPLYRLEKDIEEVTAGNLNKTFHLREQDEIQALSLSLEKMSTSLREKIQSAKKTLDELEKDLRKDNAQLTPESETRINSLKALLDQFKT